MGERKVYALIIQGLVQGVGFRPFIYRVANEMGLGGCVGNVNNGVRILVAATVEEKDVLLRRIRSERPEVASIYRMSVSDTDIDCASYTGFTIASSISESDDITQVSPDLAVCPDCMRDRERQPQRMGYPFINCTHCGPRFSIIRDLPYDRPFTTMSGFSICPDCEEEYRAVSNRRFHAQPIACTHCGPHYYARYKEKHYDTYEAILKLSSRLILEGEVIAAKGIGGYHLVCDAMNEKAVDRLREIKNRDSKPFAVMFCDLTHLQAYTFVNAVEEQCLVSWRRPIVLLKQRSRLASAVNPSMHTLGCMLPYMPVHYDWFARTGLRMLVMTSGNLGDLPIAITPEDAEAQLSGKVSFILHHDRPVYNRVDDSVLQVCGDQPCLIRRSRGYAPEPFFSDTSVDGLLSFGAEKVNTFALGKGNTLLQSQYIGDLKNWETYRFYLDSLKSFQRLFRFKPQRLVCDLHPDYLSSQEAERMCQALSLPLLKVQHHHAHAAACMLEYGLREPVIAIVMDGTGLGDDGKIWGGEFFLCDRAKYTRLSHFEYVPLPGGDKAAMEPWRMVVAYLWYYFKDKPSGIPYPVDFVERIGRKKISTLERMLEKEVNTPLTSSAGRLFDAVSSLFGICDVATHQAEAAVLLEQAAEGERNAHAYPLSVDGEEVSFYSLFEALIHDKANEMPVSLMSARFHTTLADLFVQKTKGLIRKTKATQVVLSGGCFQNKLLAESVRRRFIMAGIPVYIPSRIPCNDGGIAVGQLAIAAVTPFDKSNG